MSQIFKNKIKNEDLYDFLQNVCDKNDNYYLFNLDAYKRCNLSDSKLLNEFLEKIKPFYHDSKKFYVERKMTYTKFCTILRQICNVNSTMFTSKIIYNKSQYYIIYYIYI